MRWLWIAVFVGCQLENKDAADTAVAVNWPDADGDGYLDGYDCDDGVFAVNPAATEVCDGVDNDCDGSADEAGSTGELAWYKDNDDDGYGDPDNVRLACDAPPEAVADNTDCDDDSRQVYPGAPEICDGRDNDCDEMEDEDAVDAVTWYPDVDGDGDGDARSEATVSCPPDSSATNNLDCDDENDAINTAATELCDEIDNDCDGTTDEDDSADATTWYEDADADGYGNPDASKLACDQPANTVDNALDCDDGSEDVYSGAPEHCDELDNDCDGATDEDALEASTWYPDEDGDTYGDASSTATRSCAPDASAADGSDCDDDDAEIHPDADEICEDGVDQNCDGIGCRWEGDLDAATSDGVLVIFGGESGVYAGKSFAVLDDLDADGDAELAIGAPYFDFRPDSDVGGAFLFAGPVTSDGELADADAAYLGEDAWISAGWAIANLGDGHDDGTPDVAVSALYAYTVYLFYDEDPDASTGLPFGEDPDLTIESEDPGDFFGYAIANAHDVDADGLDDVIIGAPEHESDKSGAVYLMSGGEYTDSPSDMTALLVGGASSSYAGKAVDGPGDVDGDGYADLLIGAPVLAAGAVSAAGGAYLISGPVSGTVELEIADLIARGTAKYECLGIAVAGAGDVDADGYRDLLVGAPGCGSATDPPGIALLVSGDGDHDPLATFYGGSTQALGSAVYGPGDLNEDGYDEVFLGAPLVSSAYDQGTAGLWYGPVAGTVTYETSGADATFDGYSSGDRFGAHLGGGQDLTGDGAPDLLIAAPYESTVSGQGAVFLFPGDPP